MFSDGFLFLGIVATLLGIIAALVVGVVGYVFDHAVLGRVVGRGIVRPAAPAVGHVLGDGKFSVIFGGVTLDKDMYITELGRTLSGRELAIWTGKNADGTPINMPEETRQKLIRVMKSRARIGRSNLLSPSKPCCGRKK